MQSLTLSPSITLFQGDALDVLRSLPDDSVDMVLTDPPYSSGGSTLSTRQADPAQKYQATGTKRTYPAMLGDAKDQHSWILWSTLWLSQCLRVAREGAVCLVFTDWRQLPSLTDAVQAAGWKWMGIIPWDKRSARPQIGKFKQQCEFVVFGVKGHFIPHTRLCLPGMYSHPILAARKNHLTAKPVELICNLLAIAPEGGSVLDPFMGGGSHGAACVETGHPYIGVELSPKYFRVSAHWLAELAGLPLEGQPCA
ncbi:site-specific DNA-methyltransferase [Desulfovibrio desulfuricans]|uniref:DNA-methyltransferase n=1 Tax=Desulfovibrio desulfuricans TaxID=876 RepID=UPI001D0662B3|nr:site-specific DNA-methyltransferase [Desulfovibrio desulfuricans]MCB6543419.1 site-specific DNA-methyltransferase [Desulfovibrio desulfuricans]MCB6554490.1 site-specific DNA-methyltransferase [Desulfovibrio desulfuricans]MCB6566341.1 site-specific DNA-methyltransferase [Desulfovibrio desulfuricans]MCB7347508.1 site-specific DNA-methyltransferase [Desulfovibrio desulfuricans]MCQ4861575.1 site-specific DNA-methyltransferase [Desulfovibrio desulfuricans]